MTVSIVCAARGIDAVILEHLTLPEPKVKVELIKAVGERNVTDGFGSLLKATQDKDRKVRLESFKVLKVVCEPGALAGTG